jgi:hypothetical protein
MDPAYQESRMIVPKNLAILMAVMLIVTWASMLFTRYVLNISMPELALWISGAFFIVAILLIFAMKYSLKVYDDRIEAFYIFRTTTLMKSDILETKSGELNIIKSYTPWSLKGVRYRTFSAIGDEMGVGLKMKGKRVYYLASVDPEAVLALIPKEDA